MASALAASTAVAAPPSPIGGGLDTAASVAQPDATTPATGAIEAAPAPVPAGQGLTTAEAAQDLGGGGAEQSGERGQGLAIAQTHVPEAAQHGMETATAAVAAGGPPEAAAAQVASAKSKANAAEAEAKAKAKAKAKSKASSKRRTR